MNDPEVKGKISKSVNELYKDPDYINHRNEGIQKMKTDPSYIKRNRDRRGLKDSKVVKICVYCGEP
jgi:hypothetical protein